MSLFAVLTLTNTQIALVVLGAIAAAAIVALFFRKDQEQEKRRQNELVIAKAFSDAKMPHLASIFGKLAIGDYAGAVGETWHLCKRIAERPAALMEMLLDHFWWQFDQRIRDEKTWQEILDRVQARKDQVAAEEARTLKQLTQREAQLKAEIAAQAKVNATAAAA